MGILDDIQNGKPLQIETENPFAGLVEKVEESLLNSMDKNIEHTKKLAEMKDRFDQRMASINAQMNRMAPNSTAPPQTQEKRNEEPLELRRTAPLEQLMGERLKKQDMEDNIWQIIITIDLLKIDDLIKPTDFSNNVAYQNHKAHVARSTPPDTHPGFRITIQVGPVRSSKRIIRNSISKEEVMYSNEFMVAFKEILNIIKSKAV